MEIQPTTELTALFNSKIACAKSCWRKYYWTYVRNFERNGFYEPFFVGSACHAGLEAFYLGKSEESVIRAAEKYMDEYVFKNFVHDMALERSEKARMLVTGILHGYVHSHKAEAKNTNVVFTERTIEIPMPGAGVPYVGTIDLAIEKRRRIWIVDHKFYRTIDENVVRGLKIDPQVQMYMLMMRSAYGEKVGGCIYNMVKKPMIRQKKATKNKAEESRVDFLLRLEECFTQKGAEYMVRERVPFSKKDTRMSFIDTHQWSMLLRIMHDRSEKTLLNPNAWPKSTKACFEFGTSNKCEFFDLCRNHCTGNGVNQMGFRQRTGLERGDVIKTALKIDV